MWQLNIAVWFKKCGRLGFRLLLKNLNRHKNLGTSKLGMCSVLPETFLWFYDISKILYRTKISVIEVVEVNYRLCITLRFTHKSSHQRRRIWQKKKREFNVFDQQRQSTPLQSDFRSRLALDQYLVRLGAL